MRFTSMWLACILIIVSIKGFINREKEVQAILDYYQNVETLLDSLYIYENDSIFNTNVGDKYLESKHKFDSLIINNK